MIRVSTHLFGSTDGYHTLAKSADVSEAEDHALSIFGFGSPKSQEEIDQLAQHPSVAGRLLPGGRFAITRLFPGEPDVAGRDTVERRTILFSAHDWKAVVRCDLESLLQDSHAFEREAFTNAAEHSVLVNDSEDLLPSFGELERRLYDILLSTPRHNACALVADEPANRRGLLQLLKLLPGNEASQLSWGLGLFAATPGVRIATASTSVAAAPNVRWPSLSGNLAHPEKVALLGLQDDALATARRVQLKDVKKTRGEVLIEFVLQHFRWIVLTCAILALALVFALYTSRATRPMTPTQPSVSAPQQHIVSEQPRDATPQASLSEKTSTVKTDATATGTIDATSVPPPDTTPAATSRAPSVVTKVANQAATVAPASPATPVIPAVTPAPANEKTKPEEPVNAPANELELWKQAKSKRVSAQINSADVVHNEAWLITYAEEAKALVDLQTKIKTQVDNLNYKEVDFLNLNSTELSPKPDQSEKVCAACILVLAQCEIIATQLEINKKLASPKNIIVTTKGMNAKSERDAALQKIAMPDSMWKWITPKNPVSKETPNAKIQEWLDPKLRALFKKTFPSSTVELPSSP